MLIVLLWYMCVHRPPPPPKQNTHTSDRRDRQTGTYTHTHIHTRARQTRQTDKQAHIHAYIPRATRPTPTTPAERGISLQGSQWGFVGRGVVWGGGQRAGGGSRSMGGACLYARAHACVCVCGGGGDRGFVMGEEEGALGVVCYTHTHI